MGKKYAGKLPSFIHHDKLCPECSDYLEIKVGRATVSWDWRICTTSVASAWNCINPDCSYSTPGTPVTSGFKFDIREAE